MTKSVTALVLGVAIDRGIIADVDQSVLSFFPDYADLRTPEKDRLLGQGRSEIRRPLGDGGSRRAVPEGAESAGAFAGQP
jgi:CubicO group peptidase (beta-lactamase class C family)